MPVITIDNVPYSVCIAQICPFVYLQDRWHSLTRVSRRWRHIALTSVHIESHVDLTWCTGDDELDSAVKVLSQRRPNTSSHLESIALYGPRVTKSLLSHLLVGIGRAKIMRMNIESKQIDDTALSQLSQCTNLHTLTLHCIKFTDDAFVQITRACRSLAVVDLSGCSKICDESILALAANCQALRVLNVAMCHRITDRAVVGLAMHSSMTLETLIVDKCLKISGTPLRFMMSTQTNLRTLSFANCPKIQQSNFSAFHPSVPMCKLSSLNMRGCAALTDDSAVALVTRNASVMEELNLSALLGISSVAYEAVACCSRLHTLNLSMCRTLQNTNLAAIAEGCAQLNTLLLQGCINIDDDGLYALADHTHALERLSLEFCYNVTDAGVSAVGRQCHRLVNLNVKACNQLTTTVFHNLCNNRHAQWPLEMLYIGACADQETTAMYMAIVKQKFPRCRIHWV